MILKFDHISYIEARKKKNMILLENEKPNFVELGLKNIKNKFSLMQGSCLDHDLYFYGGGYPTEFIFYDVVGADTDIVKKNDVIYGRYNDKENAIDFLKGIFGNNVSDDDGVIKCNMRGVLDKKDYMLFLTKSDKMFETYLNSAGYGVAAVIVNSTFTRKPKDGICTEAECLSINNKDMEICFTKSMSTNIIFEIIKMKLK